MGKAIKANRENKNVRKPIKLMKTNKFRINKDTTQKKVMGTIGRQESRPPTSNIPIETKTERK